MRDFVTATLRDGSQVTLGEWQKIYGLPRDSDKIGRHFSITEPQFRDELSLYKRLVVNEPLMVVLDALREAVGVPIQINSFNRTQAHQDALKKRGFKTAGTSPHVALMAADIDTRTEAQTREWVKILLQVSALLNIKVRLGFQQYLKAGQTFIHLDVCPEYFAPGKPFYNRDHPLAWELTLTW